VDANRRMREGGPHHRGDSSRLGNLVILTSIKGLNSGNRCSYTPAMRPPVEPYLLFLRHPPSLKFSVRVVDALQTPPEGLDCKYGREHKYGREQFVQ